MKVDAAIVGIGASRFGLPSPESQLRLGSQAFKQALEDAGRGREDIDGISIHQGSPLGVDYDRFAEALGLGPQASDRGRHQPFRPGRRREPSAGWAAARGP